jgi:vacuolar-type H+-ATPase subunit E/Vma4
MIDSKRENDKLRNELNSKLQHQQELIRELMEESLRLTRQQLLSPVQTTSQNSVPTIPVNCISSPIQKMLNNYKNLDEDTKKHLFQNALLTNYDALQREFMSLQHNKISSSISLQAS